MHPLLESHREEVAELCRRRGVIRLELFGSAARDDFDESRSDLDFLVKFDSDPSRPALGSYFGFKSDLESLFHRPVDLVDAEGIRNPYVRASINRDRKLIYAA